MSLVPLPAAGEDVVVAPDGSAYVGLADGTVWWVSRDGDERLVGTTGGRPLGLELLDDDHLLVCDSTRGLLRLHRGTGEVDALVTEAAGRRLVFCNNAAVEPGGAVWFTDSSAHHGRDEWRAEMVEATATGRLLRRGPDGRTEVGLEGLDFANGVALAPGGGSVLVAETGARRVRRLRLTGPRAGTADVVLDDLPGYPDNLSVGSDGLLWVALASPRVALLEHVRRGPRAVRRLVASLPARLQPDPVPSVHVQAYDLRPDLPRLVHDVRLPPVTGATPFAMVTGVREHDGVLWLASLESAALLVHDLTR